jgi:hypothetical protein
VHPWNHKVCILPIHSVQFLFSRRSGADLSSAIDCRYWIHVIFYAKRKVGIRASIVLTGICKVEAMTFAIPMQRFLRWTGELRKEVRQGFEKERGAKDSYAMKYSLSTGRVQLKQLRDMLGMGQ